ncbi:hypothetical protein PPYR_02443 [Photinus pyralis]|uniref:Major facilitator superfamily (MFS) profile domain-containing protein n=2 Tax=Photinus pyralis TaxID=7054 RepID=A0A5N4B7F6_PHOPY|nr:facilitated trehalose transporter Tret1-like [Photinus pyralis]KAB0805473.1 hypothetical protein PPYR_02443 [Photinus pyralis]
MSENSPVRTYQILCALGVGLGGFMIGNALGWSSSAEPILLKTYDDGELRWIYSFLHVGAIVADIYICFTIDFLGRRSAIYLITLPFFFGWTILGTAESFAKFCLGRFILGFGTAVACIYAPSYITEVADKKIRGALNEIFIFAIALGMIVVYCMEVLDSMILITLPFCSVPVIFLVILLLLPGSPIMLCKKKQKENAKQTLQLFRGQNYNIDGEFEEMEKYTTSYFLEFKDALKENGCVRGTIMVISMHCAQQLTGSYAIIFFARRICDIANVLANPNHGAIIFASVQLVGSLICALLVDRLGRKPLWIVSLVLMGLSHTLTGLYFAEKEESKINPIATLAILMAAYSLGAGPHPFMMSSELLPMEVKSFSNSLAMGCSWFIGLLLTHLFSHAINTEGMRYYVFFMFGILCFVSALLIMGVLIETKRKTLEQIRNELDS